MKPFVLITGMHRSGTSFLVRALNLSGIYLGPSSDLISDQWRPVIDNLKGHWENQKILQLTEKTLALNKGAWDKPPDKTKINKKFGEKISEYCKGLLERSSFGAGFKDPRIIPCLDSWAKFLPKNFIIIGIFRDPLKTAESLKTRNGFSYEKSLKLWTHYNNSLLSLIEKHGGFLLNFDWPKSKLIYEIQKIVKKLGLIDIDISEWFSEELLHSDKKYEKKFPLTQEIKSLYKKLEDKTKEKNKQKIKISHSNKEIEKGLAGLQRDLYNQGEYFRTVNEKNLKLIQSIESLFSVFLKRKDLQKKFPEVFQGDYKNFLDWAVNWGSLKEEQESSLISPYRDLYNTSLNKILEKEKQDSEKIKLEETLANLSSIKDELSAKNQKLDETLSKLNSIQGEYDVNKIKLDETLTGLSNVEDDLSAKNQKLDETLSKLGNTEREFNLTKIKLDETLTGLSNVEDDLFAKNQILDETLSKLNSIQGEYDVNKIKLEQTTSELTNAEIEISGVKVKLDETLTSLNSTKDELTSKEQKLLQKKNEFNSVLLELQEIKFSTGYLLMRKIFPWVNKIFPPNSKSRERLRLIRKGSAILQSQGVKGLQLAYTERQLIQNQNKINFQEKTKLQHTPLENNFVYGMDSDLNSKFSEDHRTLLIRGWCFHKELKIKQLFIIYDGKEEKISNFGFPRPDIFSVQKSPQSANSGFWKIINLPKFSKKIDIHLRVVLENYEQFKYQIVSLKSKQLIDR